MEPVAWGTFLEDLVHELRTPLTSIGGFAALLAEDGTCLPEPMQRAIATIETQSARAAAMLAAVREIAALNDPRPKPGEFRRVDLTRILARAAARHGVTPVPLPGVRSVAAPDLIERAVDILIHNAVRYGTGVQTLVQRHQGRILITVADAGPGIPEAHQPMIGARPFRAARDEALRDGTGMSLMVVSFIARRHQGTIGYGRYDGFTEFELRFPADLAPTPADPG